MGRGGGAEHELQHSRGAAGLLARRGGGRVPSIRGRCARHRAVPGEAAGVTQTVAHSTSSRRAWIAVGAAIAGTLGALAIWLLSTSTGDLREQLKVWQPWSLDACALLGLLLAVYLIATTAEGWRREARPLVALSALAVALTLLVAPRTNRIFYDEQIYQGIGLNLADLRLAQVCNDGS